MLVSQVESASSTSLSQAGRYVSRPGSCLRIDVCGLLICIHSYMSFDTVLSNRGRCLIRGGGGGEGNLGGVRVGLGHRFAAAWVRVRAAFGDG